MTIALVLVLALLLLLPLTVIYLFNRLVASRNLVEDGWSGIDVQLRRRTNLIPNLVETVKAYAAHERGVFEEVTRARSQAMRASEHEAKQDAENGLTAAIGQFFAVAEAYPDLKADANFREFQAQLVETEDNIEKARRYYNGAVRRLNTQVEQFPSNLVANQFRFRRAKYFEIDDPHERRPPSTEYKS